MAKTAKKKETVHENQEDNSTDLGGSSPMDKHLRKRRESDEKL